MVASKARPGLIERFFELVERLRIPIEGFRLETRSFKITFSLREHISCKSRKYAKYYLRIAQSRNYEIRWKEFHRGDWRHYCFSSRTIPCVR